MTKRRTFLKYGALSIPAMFLNINPASASEPENIAIHPPENERDWLKVKKMFSLDKNLIFLNNGTMGPSPRVVSEAVSASMQHVNARASYGGWEATTKVIAAHFGATPEEICLTHNVTDGINIIAQGLPLKEGDEIIISNQEHVGNALPWLARAQRDKLGVKVLDLTLPREALFSQLHSLIGPKTKVLAIPHIPCTNGRVMPVEEIGAIAQEKNLFYFLDGAHGTGMLDLDFSTMNCDYYATCTHKWMLGPTGTGFLFIRKGKLDTINPIFTGAFSDIGWHLIDGNPRIDGWAQTASRYFNGTQNRSLFDGVVAAIDFNRQLGKKNIVERIKHQNDYLYESLLSFNEIQLITPETERAGICAFTFKNKDYMDFQRFCADRNIIIRAVPENDVHAIRISTHVYNTREEINTFVGTLKDYLHA